MSGWMAALDAHLQTARRYREPIREVVDETPIGMRDWGSEAIADEAERVLRARIQTCPTYAISSEMCDVLEVAARQMTEATLLAEDITYPVSDVGFAWFERSVFEAEDDELLLGDRIVMWATLAEGIYVWFVSAYPSQMSAFATIGHLYEFGEELRPEEDDLTESWGFIPALFALLHQKIAVTRDERPGRPFARRAMRAGIVPQVRVVTLRRSLGHRGEADGETGIEWDHRWIVNGHWRKQWFPSEMRHRMRWIFPYVKGPEDKPLVVKHSVFNVVR